MTPDNARRAAAGAVGAPSPAAKRFLARLEAGWPSLTAALDLPYASLGTDARLAFERELAERMARAWSGRSDALRELDAARLRQPDWFQRPEMIGYAAYVDRFAGTLRGVAGRIDHLRRLGVRYLHLMPLLQTRDGENDGGYAVSDYGAVEPRLGTMGDLAALAGTLRGEGISLCTDLVLNHVAREHAWAQRALAGDPEAAAMFHVFPDRELPDAYERSLVEVFPTFAPGSFSELPDGRWVWTTFHEFQWDLNWANPRVFLEMSTIMLDLANVGVEVLRLDAVAFLWKRMGTICQNLPEAHALLRALRACTAIVAPAVIHKAEAIVPPNELMPYLGDGDQVESDLAYHNSLMVQFWAALAPAHTGLMVEALRRFPDHPPRTAWATYLRGHDDIGWAVTDDDASAVGIADAGAHRRWLADFYAGVVDGSFASGAHFQDNPLTGDRRTSGTTASLAGLERALAAGEASAVDLAIRRILLGHALLYGWDGIPIIWMGDEVGLRNDRAYEADPALAPDNRWMHRPPMPSAVEQRRGAPGSVEQRLFDGLVRLGTVRRGLPWLHAAVPLEVVDLNDPRLFGFARRHAQRGPLLAVHNFSPDEVALPVEVLAAHGLPVAVDRLGDRAPAGGALPLAAYAVAWLTPPDA